MSARRDTSTPPRTWAGGPRDSPCSRNCERPGSDFTLACGAEAARKRCFPRRGRRVPPRRGRRQPARESLCAVANLLNGLNLNLLGGALLNVLNNLAAALAGFVIFTAEGGTRPPRRCRPGPFSIGLDWRRRTR